ncbi:MAG: hypothetical protein VCE91_09685 [Nitrospinota bacterium]
MATFFHVAAGHRHGTVAVPLFSIAVVILDLTAMAMAGSATASLGPNEIRGRHHDPKKGDRRYRQQFPFRYHLSVSSSAKPPQGPLFRAGEKVLIHPRASPNGNQAL